MTGAHRWSRPRLSDRCLARLRFDEGRCRVVLYDAETGDTGDLVPREWVVVAGMDGTRDLEGIALAAQRAGVVTTEASLGTLLRALDDAGFIEEGIANRTRAREPAREPSEVTERAARVVEQLPGYRFQCTGRGTCCRMYPTIVFSPREAARARSLLPLVLEAGDRHEHAFTPERGAGPCPGSAVALVDGGCAYLEGDLCALHRAGDAASKPLGCNLFPLTLVDDGVRVRASVAVECACVLASVDGDVGDPLVPANVRTRADLDPAWTVSELPGRVAIAGERQVDRAAYVAWSDTLLASLASSLPSDAPRVAWSIAASLDRHGLAAQPLDPFATASVDDVSPLVAALGAAVGERWAKERAWRGSRDVVGQALLAMRGATELLADRDVLAAVVAGAGASAADEAFYLRAVLFGHQLVGNDLATGLRARSVAMWIARVLPLVAATLGNGEAPPAFDRPIALVEALVRGHGLRATSSGRRL